MRSFTHRGLELEYEVSGEGAPLLFLHGMGGGINQIHSLYEAIPGVRLIAINQQGHGGSDADFEHMDFDRLGDDAAELLSHLGIDRAYFAGISMGAAVALNVALRYPGRVGKLLLIRNAWTERPMSEAVQTAYRDLGLSLKEGGAEAFYKTEGWGIVNGSTPYTRNAFLSAFDEPSSVKHWQKYLILPGQAPVASLDALHGLEMETTIVACRNDLCHPFEYGEHLQRHIPGAKLIEIPDKDSDTEGHKAMINQAARDMFGGRQ